MRTQRPNSGPHFRGAGGRAEKRPAVWMRLGAVVLMGVATGGALAGEGAVFTTLGGFEAGMAAHSVKLSGTTAYLTDAEMGVRIIDVSNPALPVQIATYDSPGWATEFQLVGTRGYLADGLEGVQILDLSQPTAPKVIGTYKPELPCLDVKVEGNRAYVACGDAGMHIVDISDPAKPVKLGEFLPTSDLWFPWANRLHVVGPVVYLSAGFLTILDVSNPAAPVELSRWEDSMVTDCSVVGNRAYVAAADNGLVVFDVANPAKPLRVTRIPAPGDVLSVRVDGNRVYTHRSVIDVSNPESPVLLGTYPVEGMGDQGLALSGDLVFQPDGLNRLNVLRVRYGQTQTIGWNSPDARVIPVGQQEPVGATASSGLPVTAEVVAGPATIEGGQIRVTGPELVELRLVQPGDAVHLPAEAKRFVNQREARLTELGRFMLPTNTYGARVVGNRAYLGNDEGGLRIVDISTLAKPVLLSTVPTTNQVVEADVVGNYAYIAEARGGLTVVDISDPLNPVKLSQTKAGTAVSVRVDGTVAYVMDLAGPRLVIVDISDPASPMIRSSTSLPGEARGTVLVGRTLYVACGWGGVQILDVTDPSAPKGLGGFFSGHTVRGLAVRGNVAFVSDYFKEALHAFDVSNPTNVVELGSVPVAGTPRRIDFVGDLAFVVAEAGGLQVFDVSQPSRMLPLGGVATGGGARDIQAIGSVLYVADQLVGLRAYRLDQVGLVDGVNGQVTSAVSFGTPVPLAATSDNGQGVRFTVLDGPGRLDGQQLIPTGVGLIRVRAHTDPTAQYLPAGRDFVVRASLPNVALERAGAALNAFWPAGLGDVRLELASSVASDAVWVGAPGTPLVGDGVARQGIDPSGGQGFLRLWHPYSGLPEPLSLVGWNRDVVLENAQQAAAESPEMLAGLWFESGLDGFAAGLPSSREIIGSDALRVPYRLQPYTGMNALILSDAEPTNSLQLATPAAFSRLFVLSASTFARGTVGSMRVHFVDGTSTEARLWESPSWSGLDALGQELPTVFPGVGRSTLQSRLAFSYGRRGYSMHQYEFDLTDPVHAGKKVSRIEFVKSFEPWVATGVYAISGVRIAAKD